MNLDGCPKCGGEVTNRENKGVMQEYLHVVKITCSECGVMNAMYDTDNLTITILS